MEEPKQIKIVLIDDQAIVRAAFSRWQEHDERADDITAVVTFIYPLDSDTSTATVVVNDMDDALNKLLL